MAEQVVFEVRQELLSRLSLLQARRAELAATRLSRYYNDPAGFARDCIDWGEDSLAPYQFEALEALAEHHRVSVRSLHGAGKTTTESVAVLWFAITRDAVGDDWKCPTTAGAWNQLERYLWPEIHKWARKLRWDRLFRDPFKPTELLNRNLNLNTGSAYAVASAIPAYIEGAHADQILYVFDEAKAIPVATWDAAEGAFSPVFQLIVEGQAQGEVVPGDVDRVALAAWAGIHGLASMANAGLVDRATLPSLVADATERMVLGLRPRG